MLSEIDAKIERSLIQWNWCHVKGHQDNTPPPPPMDRWESLNVECKISTKKRLAQD